MKKQPFHSIYVCEIYQLAFAFHIVPNHQNVTCVLWGWPGAKDLCRVRSQRFLHGVGQAWLGLSLRCRGKLKMGSSVKNMIFSGSLYLFISSDLWRDTIYYDTMYSQIYKSLYISWVTYGSNLRYLSSQARFTQTFKVFQTGSFVTDPGFPNHVA